MEETIRFELNGKRTELVLDLNAVIDAAGTRRYKLPVTPERVLTAMKKI